MAYTARVFDAPAAVVFDVLIRPETYPQWLICPEAIRSVDDDWPAVGSRFHHRVGVGPLTIPDDSEVVELRPGRVLALRVRARPFVSAVARFEVMAVGERRCVVTLEEEPTLRSIGALVRPVVDPVVHARNHRSLRRLANVVAARRRPPT